MLTGNSALYGGGAHYGTLNNCTLTGNSADEGGGACGEYLGAGQYLPCELYNCTLTGNSAYYGGGASWGTLNNCTLTGNSAYSGGGASGSTLNNCILYYNTAPSDSGPNYSSSALNYCCTTPMPPYSEGNITTDPQLASASHLSANSPCREQAAPPTPPERTLTGNLGPTHPRSAATNTGRVQPPVA